VHDAVALLVVLGHAGELVHGVLSWMSAASAS
jgi:hypothetical protein